MNRTNQPISPEPLPAGIGKHKTVEQLAAEQGVEIPQDISKIMGVGSDLWNDDEELDAFLADIREARSKMG